MCRSPGRLRILVRASEAVLVGLLAIVLVRCAWEADDAWITFRTVWNWFHGHGLRWNVVERVQAYTHPLWMLASAACYAVSHELYFSVLALSIVLTLAAALVLSRSSNPASVALLVASSATVDFCVSGLETPLLVLLLVLFVREVRRDSPRTSWLALLAGLVGLTRLDAILLVAPALGVHVGGRPLRRALPSLALGLAPLAAWHLFSLVYYGFAFPNTAYAKLNLHVPLSDVLVRGELYAWDSLTHDPITLLVAFAAVAAAFPRGTTVERALAWGVVLDLAYVVAVGGDFMSGRFFVPPFVTAVPLLWLGPLGRTRTGPPLTAAVALAVALALPGSRLRSGADFGSEGPDACIRASGIADERGYYYPETALLRVWPRRAELARDGLPVPPYIGALSGRRAAAEGVRVKPIKQAGYFGYFAGPDVYVVDRFALADPLLARLPFEPPPAGFRVGHYERPLPAGYVESVLSDNRIEDPAVHALDDAVRLVTRGPVWSLPRWETMIRMQLGLGPPPPAAGYR